MMPLPALDPARFLLFAVMLVVSTTAYSGEPHETNELGVRYWYSTGATRWNHTADDPTFGDPTSVLAYERLEAHSLELYFRRALRQGWFVRGDFGLGVITRGSLDDEDFAASQVKFSDTTSRVKGNSVRHLTLDLGKVIADAASGNAQLYLFAGHHYWSERHDAYGLANAAGFSSSPTLVTSVPVISNEIRWSSLRTGIGVTYEVHTFAFLANLALVPYAAVHNRDFHYLRADLGGVPNIHMNGHGTGWQFDAEVRRALNRRVHLGVGVRYWKLNAAGDVNFGGGGPLRLNAMSSQRAGITATLVWRY